jgi:hypothetical protein
VMEYIDGPDLEQLLTRQDMPREVALMVLLQALKGLHYAHQQHIIHRDVKPGNILVSMNGQAKIMDFGLAHAGSQALHLTATEAIVGTPQYMSPEQANGVEAKDPRMDVFSAAIVLYRCLTGVLPFTGNTIPAVLFSITQNQERAVQGIVPTVPPPLAAAVHAALVKDPERRLPSLEPLIAALQEYFFDIGVPDTVEMVRLCLADPQRGAGQLYARLLYYHLSRARQLAEAQEVDLAKAHLEEVLKLDPGNSDAVGIVKVLAGGTTLLHRFRKKEKSPEAKLLARERRGRVPWSALLVTAVVLAVAGAGGWYGWRYVPLEKLKRLLSMNEPVVPTPAPAPVPVADPAPPVVLPPPDSGVVASAEASGQRSPPQMPVRRTTTTHKTTQPTRRASPKGSVTIRLQPHDSRLMVDGTVVKVTNGVYKAQLGAGRHEVRAIAPGHDEFSRLYDVAAGSSQIIEIALREVEKTGSLHVHSYPWAELFVDGRYRGNTPTAAPLELSVGRHSVVLTRNGYRQHEAMIEVEPGKQVRLKVDLIQD